jgi:hypothetical protein
MVGRRDGKHQICVRDCQALYGLHVLYQSLQWNIRKQLVLGLTLSLRFAIKVFARDRLKFDLTVLEH